MTESGTHLATSRVNRLLRPLRNKCNSLAALAKPATASRVTYSKQLSCWNPDCRPPLIILCRSVGVKKLTLDRHSAGEFELSRRIYAVCDAFKNIVRVAYDQPCNERILSLAAMCTLVVGENMPAANSATLAEPSEDVIHENVVLDGDGIYEAVPPHYRRFLIVSHALSMVISICTHHHTLVTVLLDHCLSSGLVHESSRLLNIILARAFLPSNPSFPPPITHPAHTDYLIDLYTKWTTGGKSSGTSSGSLLFTTSTFCQVVLYIMSQSTPCNFHILWTSTVLDKFLHAVEGCDIDSYIDIIHALSQSFGKMSSSALDAMQDDTQLVALRDKLCELISNLYDLLFTQQGSFSSPLTPSRIFGAIDILCDCHAARLHYLRMSTPGFPIDLPDILVVFTTHIHVAFRSSIDNSDRLLAILDDSSPTPTTFSKLVGYISRLQDSLAFGDSIEAFFAELERYSSALRCERLFGLDASLWACALHHFETSIASSQKGGSNHLVTRYKQQLMEAVDAAERRCFGEDMKSSPIVLSVCSSRAKRTQRGRPSGHWEWEDMVDSWIRKTPMHKRRKIDDGRPHTPSRHRPSPTQGTTASKAVSESISISTPLSIRHRCSSVFSSSTSSRFSEPESRTEDGSEYQEESDKENYPRNSAPIIKASKRIKRRSSNFFSLLADAQTNRIVLHSRRRDELKSPRSVIPEKYVLPLSSQESRHAPQKHYEQKESYRRVSPPPAPPGSLQPSDDSLDLFAYATSSPPRC